MARILVVEDELLIAEDLKYKLTRLGHTVVGCATTGEAALREAAETRPELLMMDFRLRGEMNGMEAARRIREIQDLPVVYVTAHASSVAAECNAHPRQSFLTKPFTIGELESVITTACSGKLRNEPNSVS